MSVSLPDSGGSRARRTMKLGRLNPLAARLLPHRVGMQARRKPWLVALQK